MNDLISRQAAIEAMATWDWQELYLPIHFKQLLEDLPPAQPKRKKGKWDKKSIAFYWKCSECGAVVSNDRHDIFLYPILEQLNYCPFCGADMRGE